MMIIVKMAAEFQGFSRDLHDEAAEFLANNVAGGNRAVADTIKIGLTSGRSLGRNNAGPDTLVNDFARIGLILWRAITIKEPTRGPTWKADLKDLMEMRNAIAHDDQAKLLKLEAAGLVIDRTLTSGWHGSLASLAATMDDVVASYFATLLGVPRPW